MNLISQIFFAILMTMVTGTLAFGIWGVVRHICVRFAPVLPYLLLRIVCLLYVLPICYICIQLTMRDGFLRVDSAWQMNFAPAGELCALVVVMATGWIFLTGRQIRVCLFAFVERRKQYRCNVPEENAAVLDELTRVKEKLHVRGNVLLHRNRHVKSPGTYGILDCHIVLPMQSYSKEQLSVIFHHELMHYKSRDYAYRFLAKMIGVVWSIGPISDILEGALKEWSEIYCDRRAVDALCGEMNATRYFEMIVELAPVWGDSQSADHICLGLYENQYRLGRRIDFMNKYGKAKKTTRGVMAVAALVFAITSVTPVYAAGHKMEAVHHEVYQDMESINENVSADLEEIYLPAEVDDTYEVLEYVNPEAETVMPLLDEDEIKSINWTVSPNVRKVSTSFWVKEGQVISISTTASPGTCEYWIGIMNDGNDVRYVRGSGSFGYDFEIEESGLYRVLVQNRSRVTLTVGGNYMFYTPTEEDTEEAE